MAHAGKHNPAQNLNLIHPSATVLSQGDSQNLQIKNLTINSTKNQVSKQVLDQILKQTKQTKTSKHGEVPYHALHIKRRESSSNNKEVSFMLNKKGATGPELVAIE